MSDSRQTASPSPGALRRREILATYVPLGDPALDHENLLDLYASFSPDVLEIGLPSADPYLDGPTVRSSMQRSRNAGWSVCDVIDRVSEWKTQTEHTPHIVWMCYHDQDLSLLSEAVQRGAMDGLLMVDSNDRTDKEDLDDTMASTSLGMCDFLGWDTSDSALERARSCRGYIMAQSRPGVTGAPVGHQAATRRQSPLLDWPCPVVSGFGISGRDDIYAAARSGHAGVVVGTACVAALTDGIDHLQSYGGRLRRWVDEAFVESNES